MLSNIRRTQKYSQVMEACPLCGNERWVRLGRSGCICNKCRIDNIHLRKREKHPLWRGGIHKNNNGYVMVYMPEHPHSHKSGYILRSHIVIEKKIGRFVLPHENVHHINGIKDDDREDNLYIMTHGQHTALTNRLYNKAYNMSCHCIIQLENEWNGIDKPKEGQQIRGHLLGYITNYICIFSRCPQCGYMRWVSKTNMNTYTCTNLCHRCSSINNLEVINKKHHAT